MEQLYVFGTGHAGVTRCYNTCFAIRDGQEYFLVDAGGGNGILRLLDDMKVPLDHIHHIFITHEHTDHILGVVWLVRMIGARILSGKYDGNLNLYCHDGLPDTIVTLCRLTIQSSITDLFGKRILLVPVKDGSREQILDYTVTFFDIHSTKARQFGFTTILKNGKKLTCAGDEPYNPVCRPFVEGSVWLLHEAFCLYSQKDRYKPYEKHHSTVKDACELAESLGIPNLVLWHTEDDNLSRRRELYEAEGKSYYHGNLFVPYDKEIINL